jgi:hypothetical protein
MKLIILLLIFIGILISIHYYTNYYIVEEAGPSNRINTNIKRVNNNFIRIGENRYTDRGVNISTNLYNQNSYCWNNPQSTLCR